MLPLSLPLNFKIGIGGIFTVETQKPGEPIRHRGTFHNVVTDVGLNLIGHQGPTPPVYNALDYCHVGTGNTNPPSESDTQLDNWVMANDTYDIAATIGGAQPTPPYFGWYRKRFIFLPGRAQAYNLTELGISDFSSGANLFSRQFFRDSGDNPIVIELLPEETLYVTYELRTYPPTVDVTYQLDIDGVLHDIIIRAAAVTEAQSWGWAGQHVQFNVTASGFNGQSRAYTDTIGTIEQSPNGLFSNMDMDSNPGYQNNSLELKRRFIVPLAATNINNNGGARSFDVFTSMGKYQVDLGQLLAKTEYQEIWFDVTVSWGRYTPP